MIEFVKEEDKLWEELKPLIPLNRQPYSNDIYFVNSILTLLEKKVSDKYNNRFVTSLNWELITPPNWRPSYNRRFNRWRENGVWEKMLCVLVKYKDFRWLGNPYIYTILLRDYKFFTSLNKLYLCSIYEGEIEMLNDLENQYLLHAAYPKCMKNRNRRLKANCKKQRGAYKNTYSPKEQEFIKSLEYGENDIDV